MVQLEGHLEWETMRIVPEETGAPNRHPDRDDVEVRQVVG
jgi:hypothetical protein